MKLAVNVDHFATIREARKSDEPEPALAALLAEQAGAEGIVCHIRGDRRHIKERDLRVFREVIKTKLNIEMAAITDNGAIVHFFKVFLADHTAVPSHSAEKITKRRCFLHGHNLESIHGCLKRLERIHFSHMLSVTAISLTIFNPLESKGMEINPVAVVS